MKKLLALATLLLVAIIALIVHQATNQPQTTILLSTPVPTPKPVADASGFVTLDNRTYAIFIQEVTDPSSLTLIPNFSQELSSEEIVANNTCSYGINAGFYTPEQTPLGLFTVDGETLQEQNIESTLINGFFTKYLNNTLSFERPGLSKLDDVDFALQSGPLFSPNSKLSIIDDKFARRMLIVQTEDDTWYFIAVTADSNTLTGPRLADLPRILDELRTMNYELREALNLDGGSASAFYSSEGISLTELNPIGSFLCGK